MTVPLGGMIDGNLMESMASLSMLQRVSTGYVVLDILLCALIPVILQKIKPYAQELWRWLSADADTAKFTRHVKFVKREGYYHYDPAEKNHLLQEAILTYIGSQEHLVQKFSVRSRERLLHNNLCTHHSHGFSCIFNFCREYALQSTLDVTAPLMHNVFTVSGLSAGWRHQNIPGGKEANARH